MVVGFKNIFGEFKTPWDGKGSMISDNPRIGSSDLMDTGSTISIDFYEYIVSDQQSKPSQWTTINPQIAMGDHIESFRLVTWNIWFDKLEQDLRNSSILQELFSIPSVDIIAIQEATTPFLELIQSDKRIRTGWIITDYRDINYGREISSNWYGNIFLVRKKWIGNIRGWVKMFPTSNQGRFIEVLEISRAETSVVWRSSDERLTVIRFELVVHILSLLERTLKNGNDNPISLDISLPMTTISKEQRP